MKNKIITIVFAVIILANLVMNIISLVDINDLYELDSYDNKLWYSQQKVNNSVKNILDIFTNYLGLSN